MTETRVLTLAEFLLARIAEDEAEARTAAEFPWSIRSTPGGRAFDLVADGPESRADHWLCVDPARVLAECEAKRRIVEQVEQLRSEIPRYVLGDGDEHEAVIVEWADATILPALAAAYADHPDYREEWRA